MKIEKIFLLSLNLSLINFFFTSFGFADQQKVVFITSLNTSSIKNISTFFNKNYYQDYVEDLEEMFLDRFSKTNYKIEIISDADQFEVWHVLHDPRNIAVLWLSHAGFENSPIPGNLIKSSKIIDSKGYDITPVFEKIHPNLRFLAVIGCFSKNVMNNLPRQSHDPKHPDHPFLRLYTFSKKVDAKKGLETAISEAQRVLDIPEIRLGYNSSCPSRKGYKVNVTRHFQLSDDEGLRRFHTFPVHPAGRIMSENEIVGVFPKGFYNQSTQTESFFVPDRGEGLPMLRFDVGANSQFQTRLEPIQGLDIGILSFRLADDQVFGLDPWSLWRDHQGKAIGVTSNSYQPFKGGVEIDVSPYLTEEPSFVCQPMPSYDE